MDEQPIAFKRKDEHEESNRLEDEARKREAAEIQKKY